MKEDDITNHPMPSVIQYQGVALSRAKRTLVDGFDCTIRRGTRIAVLGPSGCGKSTLLAAILGMIKPDRGMIYVGGHQAGTRRAAAWLADHAGILFQREALFDGWTVEKNLRFAFQRCRGEHPYAAREEQDQRILELLDMVGLDREMLKRVIPHQLSGGQRKRVALARALALKPDLLLLDEPTSGLDPQTSSELAVILKSIFDRELTTVFCISHDPNFTKAMGCTPIASEIFAAQGERRSPVRDSAGMAAKPLRLAVMNHPVMRDVMAVGQRTAVLLGRGALLCAPVALITGAGLIAQSVGGPPWVRSFIPQAFTAGVFLGLGTILPALLMIGLCVSGVAGEIAQRKHNDQLNYLKATGNDPLRVIAVPVILGFFLALPVLVLLSEVLMIAGGRLALMLRAGDMYLSPIKFQDQVWSLVSFDLFLRTAIKGATHGLLSGAAACLFGFASQPGEAGLQRAVASAVLAASFSVILADLLWSLYWMNASLF